MNYQPLQNIVTVGATGRDGLVANFSCYGKNVNLWAPGEAIWSTAVPSDRDRRFYWTGESTSFPRKTLRSLNPIGYASFYNLNPNSYYAVTSGTSMATPHVAGALARLKNHYSKLSPAELISTLVATGVSIPQTLMNERGDQVLGSRLNLANAFASIKHEAGKVESVSGDEQKEAVAIASELDENEEAVDFLKKKRSEFS